MKKKNGLAVTGFILGIVSTALSLTALLFSIFSLASKPKPLE